MVSTRHEVEHQMHRVHLLDVGVLRKLHVYVTYAERYDAVVVAASEAEADARLYAYTEGYSWGTELQAKLGDFDVPVHQWEEIDPTVPGVSYFLWSNATDD